MHPLSLGQFTILFNLLIVLVQLPILKKSSSSGEHWLQVPVTLLFGWFIDLTMVPWRPSPPDLPLEAGLPPPGLPDSGLRGVPGDGGQRGHAPGESFVRAVSTTWHRDFGLTKNRL